MHVTRFAEAKPYDAQGHFAMACVRLQGQEVSPSRNCWMGVSHFLPGGGAESSASNTEKIYVVLAGEMTITTDEGDTILAAMDSCYLAAGERRALLNRSHLPATMLVVVGYQQPVTSVMGGEL